MPERQHKSRPPQPAAIAIAVAWCAWAAVAWDQDAAVAQDAAGQSTLELAEPPIADDDAPATPLLSYRRAEAGETNPLRATPTAPPAPAPTQTVVLAPAAPAPAAHQPYANQPFANQPFATQSFATDSPSTVAASAPPAGPSLGMPRYALPASAIDVLPEADRLATGDAALPPASENVVSAPPAAAAVDDYDVALPLPAAATIAPAPITAAAIPAANPAPPSLASPAAAADAAARRLAPPSSGHSDEAARGAAQPTKYSLVPTAFSQLKSLGSAGAALAVVVALFLACALLLRRGGPKPTGVLPAEAFAVLGRSPLTAQSFAQLLRLGNKLVLVAVTADGAQPLAEVTDAAEVDRIAGLCLGSHGGGPSAEFQQVLAQLSREPAKGFLGREGSTARRRA
jgi:flagellar biogenesis protein FliO